MNRSARRGVAVALAFVVGTAGPLTASPAFARTPRVELVNYSTKLRADVMWGSEEDGTELFLWPNNRSLSQEFSLEPKGGDWFQIRALHTGSCLTIQRGAPLGNGTRLAQYPCVGNGYKSEQWKFKDMNGNCEDNALCVDAGRRVIVNRYTGRCIDTGNPSGRKPPRQSVLQQWDCIRTPKAWNADNQIWIIYDPSSGKAITHPR